MENEGSTLTRAQCVDVDSRKKKNTPTIPLLSIVLINESPISRQYSHSASMPISLHFLSRHSWHFLRMYMSISQFPPLLHLYTAFFVMLRLKKPEYG